MILYNQTYDEPRFAILARDTIPIHQILYQYHPIIVSACLVWWPVQCTDRQEVTCLNLLDLFELRRLAPERSAGHCVVCLASYLLNTLGKLHACLEVQMIRLPISQVSVGQTIFGCNKNLEVIQAIRGDGTVACL